MQGKDKQQRVERRPGPTPAGGAWSEAYYAEDGTIVEIVEYDAEGRAVARTYGEWQEMKRPSIVLHADAADGDWIKGDRVRLGDDGAIYVRDLSVPGGTRRVERGEADWRELADRLNDEERARVLREEER